MWNRKVQEGELPAPWNDYANADEKQRLAVIEGRLELKKTTVEELLAERRRIMTRCIRRMRRREGKE